MPKHPRQAAAERQSQELTEKLNKRDPVAAAAAATAATHSAPTEESIGRPVEIAREVLSREPAAPPPPVAAARQVEDVEAYYEQRIRSMTGNWQRERQEMVANVDRLTQSLTGVQEQMRALAERTPEPPPPSLVTPEDIEQMGEDFAQRCARMVAEGVERASRPLKQEIEALKATVTSLGGTVTQSVRSAELSAQELYVKNVGDILGDPNWVGWAIKPADPRLVKWLSENHPEDMDDSYLEIVNRYHTERNAKRVAGILQKWVKSLGEAPVRASLETRQVPNGNNAGPTHREPNARSNERDELIAEAASVLRPGRPDVKRGGEALRRLDAGWSRGAATLPG